MPMKPLPLFAWLYDIAVDDAGIAFVLLRFAVVYRLQFQNIERVTEIGRASVGALSAYNFKSRLFARSFLVQARRGWFARKVLVTPDDPDTFITQLRRHSVDVR